MRTLHNENSGSVNGNGSKPAVGGRGLHRRTTGQRRRRRAQIRHGHRRAALQGITAAKLWLKAPITAPTQAAAAEMTGSNIAYVRAASILVQYGDADLIADVEAGQVSLLQAAAAVQKRVELIGAITEQNRKITSGSAVQPDPTRSSTASLFRL
jgi:hypothetical protein